MANTTSKDIDLLIKATDQTSKPVEAIASSIDKLVASVAAIAPASDKGEVSMGELNAIAKQLTVALEGLGKNLELKELFELLTTKVGESAEKLEVFRNQLTGAKTALEGAAAPTRELQKAVTSATSQFASQEKELTKYVAQLDRLRTQARTAGLDLDNLGAAQLKIDEAFAAATPAYEKINTIISEYAATQRRVAEESRAAAAQQAQAAEQAATAARVEQAGLNARAAAQRDYDVMLQRTVATQQRKQAADAAAAAAFQKEIAGINAVVTASIRKVAVDGQAAATARLQIETINNNIRASIQKVAADNAAADAAARDAAAEAARAAQLARVAEAYRSADQASTGAARSSGAAAAAARAHAGATQDLGTSQGKLNGLFAAFSSGSGRESLSLYQRLRGEVLSLTATYVGLFGAINSVGSILDVVNKRNSATNLFEAAFGKGNVAQEMDYVRAAADKLAFRFLDLADSYGKFAVAARASGLSVHDTRVTFESIIEVSRNLHLTQEQTNNIFLAFQQIASKGKFQMQELRQQLGNDLPGAFGILAKSLHVTDQELEKTLAGKGVSASFIPVFATALREQFTGGLEIATKSAQANLQRFGTAVDDLKLKIADGGFLEAFSGAVQKLSAFLRSADGQKFADNLTTAFTKVAQAINYIIDHLNDVMKVVEVLAVFWVAKFTVDMVAGVAPLLGALGKIRTSLLLVGAAADANSANMATFGNVFGRIFLRLTAVLGAFVAGFEFGTYLYNSSTTIQKWSQVVVGYVVELTHKIKATWLQYMPAWLGGGSKDEIEAAKKQVTQDAAIIADLIKTNFDDAAKKSQNAAQTAAPAFVKTELTPEEKAAKQAEADKDRMAALEDAAKTMEARLSELRGQLLHKEATNFAEFRAGLQTQYEGFFKEIAKLAEDFPSIGAAKARALAGQLKSILDATAANAVNTFNQKKVEQDYEAINGLLRERNALIAGEKLLSSKAGGNVESQETARKNIEQISNDFNTKIATSVTQLQNFINSLPPNIQAKLQKTIQDLKIVTSQLINQGGDDKVDDLTKAYERANDQLRIRDALVEAAKAKLKNQNADQQTTINTIKGINDTYKDQLKILQDIENQIESGNGLTDEQKKQLQDLLAKVQLRLAKEKEEKTTIYSAVQAAQDLAQGGVSVADAFTKAVAQTGSLSQGFKSAKEAFLNFAADFLLKIGEMILKAELLKLVQTALGTGDSTSVAGIISAGVTAATQHDGGVAGQKAQTRAVAASVFAGAARFHDGGLPGLKPGEIPTILKKGEEVLTDSDPRHVANGGKGGGGRQPLSVAVHNHIDSESVTQAGLASPRNQKVIMNIIRANRNSLKGALA